MNKINQFTKNKKKWSSPELLDGQKYSPKSDIWSFGIVCIEILTRKPPYPGMTPTQVNQTQSNKSKF